MAQETIVANASVVDGINKVNTQEKTSVTVKDDIISRVGQMKSSTVKQEVSEPTFNFEDINKIQDPVAKEYAMNAYKSFQKGFNSKFQEIAELRKTLENEKNSINNWTPERIQSLLKDERFVNAAQSIIGDQHPQGQADEYSNLSESEKAKIKALENELKQIKSVSYQQTMRQNDEILKQKYAHYDPNEMDIITADVLQGKAQITREHIFKAIHYEDDIKKAYELGKQDKQLDTQEKVTSMSFGSGPSIVSSSSKTEMENGESDQAYLKRLFMKNMQNMTKK
jgi:hypothetical protein